MSNYQSVTWSPGDDLDAPTLNQMADNEDWLYNNRIDGYYNIAGIHKNTKLKITGGKFAVGPTKDKTIYKEISWGNFFSEGCAPIVTVSHTGARRVFITLGGIGSGNQQPDSKGFSVSLLADPNNATKNYFPNLIHVHYIAFGF